GQYNPGAISLWRGSKDGFLPRQFVDQEGFINSTTGYSGSGPTNPTANAYWNYTSADFADFNGDGLLDLFVGGTGGPRVALNIGTKENPKFGLRTPLLHIDGTPLRANTRPRDDGRPESYPNVSKSYLHPIDWDGDGVLDILMTHEYDQPGHYAIEFFRGVQTPDGLRFEKPVPLFTTADGSKALPGCQPMIAIADLTGNGVMDIVIGLSIPTINGYEAVPEVAWEWHRDLGISMPGKDTGRQIKWDGGIEGAIRRIEENPAMRRSYLGRLEDYKYLTMRHRGYVFVMYGAHNTEKAVAAVEEETTNLTLHVPRGMNYNFILEDGTQVCLDGDSKLHFPTVFGKTERRVILEGEGYFDVKSDSERPFIVETANSEKVQVTGASFVIAANSGSEKEEEEEQSGPVSFRIRLPNEVTAGREYVAMVTILFQEGWHGYSDTPGNRAMGFIPTQVEFIFPEGTETGVLSCSSNSMIYEDSVSFTQKFTAPQKDGALPVTIKIQYQVCDESMCLPPEEHTVERIIPVRNRM
ncbi:MAG: FG-GAP-like repeat-containing protein, partial [Rikenellaceae bacterium]|nr:FG-GAP-like repeat-containing protein [Rikenellaceae bacterium]MCL2693374.1 FG-GAP-like repeat-containing protein [Rikenellaceae bacterium]